MNKGMLTVGIILLSLIALLLINVLTNFSTGSELDYYLVKETTSAAMTDAQDYDFLRICGVPRIDKEKFVESFLYRLADNVDTTRGYTVSFYDINEVPPKVSVKVDSENQAANITTSYDAILEVPYTKNMTVATSLENGSKSVCNFDNYEVGNDVS